jgi:hypothetical protein
MLPTKEEEITRSEASFLRGTKLERGRHSGSSPDSHFTSLSPYFLRCMERYASPWTCSNSPCFGMEVGAAFYSASRAVLEPLRGLCTGTSVA